MFFTAPKVNLKKSKYTRTVMRLLDSVNELLPRGGYFYLAACTLQPLNGELRIYNFSSFSRLNQKDTRINIGEALGGLHHYQYIL